MGYGGEGRLLPKLLIVDDHSFMRASLRSVFDAEIDFKVAGEAKDGLEALALCRELRPELILMDVSMPKMNGIEATTKIKEEFPEISVLILTAHVDQRVLLDAVRAGAAGYVLKGDDNDKLLGAVRAVLNGETPLEQGLAMQLLRRLTKEADQREQVPEESRPAGRTPSAANPLSPRETEVLGLLATGKTNRQLAATLHLSVSTVKRHVERIISKLGVSDRTQAAVKAIDLGFLPERNQL